jgi:hypothetical protein
MCTISFIKYEIYSVVSRQIPGYKQGFIVGVGIGWNFRCRTRSRYIFNDSETDLNLKSKLDAATPEP